MNLMSNEFTQQVSDIVVYGKEEANRLQNDHIEPEHLLLGILRDGECKAAEILKSFYLDLKGIKNELETQLREKSILENYSQDISFSEEASKILTLSKLEARLMNDEKVDTPHILLAIMRDNQNNAYKILEKNDVTYEKIIDRLKQEEAPFDGLDFNDDEEEEASDVAETRTRTTMDSVLPPIARPRRPNRNKRTVAHPTSTITVLT